MADDFPVPARQSAAAQGSHRHTPFDDILTVERDMEQRVERELASMDERERTETTALREKEHAHAEEVRGKAQLELQKFKESTLPSIMKDATTTSEAERSRIRKAAAANEKTIINSLVQHMLSADFAQAL